MYMYLNHATMGMTQTNLHVRTCNFISPKLWFATRKVRPEMSHNYVHKVLTRGMAEVGYLIWP